MKSFLPLLFSFCLLVGVVPVPAQDPAVEAKAKSLIVPVFEVQDATLPQLIQFIQERSKMLDPEGKGIEVKLSASAAKVVENATLSLDLKNIPISELLKTISQAAALEVEYNQNTAFLVLPSALQTKSFEEISSSFFGQTPKDDSAVKAFLEEQGVPFPEGSQAKYEAASRTLTVSNTAENIQLLSTLISIWRQATP